MNTNDCPDDLVTEGIRRAIALIEQGHPIGRDSDAYTKILLPASKGEINPTAKIFSVEMMTTLQYDKSILSGLKAENECVEVADVQFFLATLSAFNVANLLDCPWLLKISLRRGSKPVPM